MNFYRDLANKYGVLSAEEEKDLLIRAKDGDVKARNKILYSNVRYVIQCAGLVRGCSLSLEDIVTEGFIGLIKAMDLFELNSGVRFLTYARWWVQEYIANAVRSSRMISIPKKKMLALKNSCEMKDDKYLMYAKNAAKSVASLDAMVGDGDGATLGEFIEDPNLKPDEKYFLKEMSSNLNRILSSLSDREQKILSLSFGLKDGNEMSNSEVAESFGISRQRVDQIKKNAFRKLNTESNRRYFEGYVSA